MQRLSSGLRINSAADDAANLSISEKLRGQIRGLDQANRNVQDGMGALAVMDGALDQIGSILIRARELAVQFNNGILSFADKSAIITELGSLSDEVGRIASSTVYNGVTLLAAPVGTMMTLQVGANDGEVIAVSLMNTFGAAGTVRPISFFALPWLDADITGLDGDAQNVALARANIGAMMNRLDHVLSANQLKQENLMSVESRIRDTDFAQEITTLTRQQILQQSGTSLLAQANQNASHVLALLR